jgi:hypothetical protein
MCQNSDMIVHSKYGVAPGYLVRVENCLKLKCHLSHCSGAIPHTYFLNLDTYKNP